MLYVIGTPIGNLEDISLRSLRILGEVEILVCEDSRVSSQLINCFAKKGMIKRTPKYFSYNEFNEDRVYLKILEWLKAGKTLGLVTDAGMPTVSDPGYRLIRAALQEGIEVEIIPGPTALTTALAWSGVGGEAVLYLGFLPKKEGKARKMLKAARVSIEEIKALRVVLYVSPHRLVKELNYIKEEIPSVRVVLLREMTKLHKERVEETIEELITRYSKKKIKGEIVIVLYGLTKISGDLT